MNHKDFNESPVKMIQITEDSYLSLSQDYLKSTISRNANLVVSIVGRARSGRSSLMNELFGTSFSTSSGLQPHTKDTWIQDCIGITHHKLTSKISLIDIQGFGTTTDASAYNKMVLAALMISDVVIFTSPDGNINQQQIRRFGSIVNKLKQLLPSKPDKCSLIWVVRNFILQLVDRQGNQITINQYLEKSLQTKNNSTQNSYLFRSSIKQYFGQRQCLFLPPFESPNYFKSFQQLKNQVFQILRSKQEHRQSRSQQNSISCNSKLKGDFLKNIINQFNTNIFSNEKDLIKINQIYKGTLIDYLSSKTAFEQQSFIDRLQIECLNNENDIQLFQCESAVNKIMKKSTFDIRKIWLLYFGTQVNQQIVQQVEKCLQIKQRNREIQKLLDFKIQSCIFQFKSYNSKLNQSKKLLQTSIVPRQQKQCLNQTQYMNTQYQQTKDNRRINTDDAFTVDNFSVLNKTSQLNSVQNNNSFQNANKFEMKLSKLNKRASMATLMNLRKPKMRKLKLEDLPKPSKPLQTSSSQLVCNYTNILSPKNQNTKKQNSNSTLVSNKSFTNIHLREALLQQALSKSKQNQRRLENHIQTLHRILQQQQQSYKRRLNLSKQYMKRIQNQNQIVRKQLFYCKNKIQNFQKQYQYFENIEVFECWKCLQRIVSDNKNHNIVSHMRICLGPVNQQLEITVLCQDLLPTKGKVIKNLNPQQKIVYIISIKVIPTRNRRWEIKRQHSQIIRLQASLVRKYHIQGINQIQTNDVIAKTKANISKKRKERKLYNQQIQRFLNRCVSHKQICCDYQFKEFLAGN